MPSDAELLKAYLAERDVPCPGCGYSLKGCVSDKCPECGEPLHLTAGRPSPPRRWVWGLAWLGYGAGASLPLILFMVISRLMYSTNFVTTPRRKTAFGIYIVHFIVCLVLLHWWSRPSHATLKWATRTRLALAATFGLSGTAAYLVWVLFY